jgi:peptidyl-prolyl cis-trans isomerase A (cyclophilin A)
MSIHTQTATIHTNHGEIRINLFGNHAPKTVANFVGLADGTTEWTHPQSGEKMTTPLYDGVIFHRIIPGFMIQGGDPLGMGFGGPGYQFEDEIHPELNFSQPFILAMANSGPGTNGSQFFITEKETPWLDGRHAVFGKIVVGAELIGKITRVDRGPNDKPKTPVNLERVEIFRSEAVPTA